MGSEMCIRDSGKTFVLSPEESIRIQKGLNSDIVMVMDECPKNTKDYDKIKKSMELSSEWAKRSKNAFGDNPHKGLFGIVQGGLFNDLRLKSLEQLINIDFDGYAMGGLAVGETQKEMFDVLDGVKDYLPKDKPRYLMGVGTPSDIIGAVKRVLICLIVYYQHDLAELVWHSHGMGEYK